MPPRDTRPDSLLRRGRMGTGLVVLAVVVAAGLVVAAIRFFGPSDDGKDAEATAEVDAAAEAGAGTGAPPLDAGGGAPDRRKAGAVPLEKITWTTEAPATLKELSGTWSIPVDELTGMNPDLPEGDSLAAGTKVVVQAHLPGDSVSVGPPNDGRLIGGVPLPEGKGWNHPEDRSRAFAMPETLASLTSALVAYGQRFPDADPIQLGDLSARRGGQIYGHQSHQSGRDVDVRLVPNGEGGGFDPERNWFLVKTLIDAGDITAIFLNASEQSWLRAAAEADVGVDTAATYFELIDHERGHTIHMHVRFACPEGQSRCVSYAQPDAEELDPRVGKLPPGLGGKTTGKSTKLPKSTGTKAKTLKPKKKPR